ncbi:protein kinase domain-containing protein [Streptomyces yaizuensis]|uniref:Protein kinase n=1 Tax=Streptomyces yaizuensis TaxID=2989713 RepID=A0ABQ5P228_9ACTN|nr:protein kinase [Streptomyces sp. YSPA8]GLF96579.1 protein kinase [Streptomyces sp. YSPA8]
MTQPPPFTGDEPSEDEPDEPVVQIRTSTPVPPTDMEPADMEPAGTPPTDVETTGAPLTDVETTGAPLTDVETTGAPLTDVETTGAPPTDVEASSGGAGRTEGRSAEGRSAEGRSAEGRSAGGRSVRGPRPRGDTGRLPRSLRDRFRLLSVVRRPQEPHRAAVFRVEDADGGVHVLKWYAHGHAPEPEVWQRLRHPHPRLARLTETDPAGADGHPYDLSPSYGETDLATYLRDNAGPRPTAFVTALVRQLHEALTALHTLGIVHRDLSPANVVLGRIDGTDPELTLVDFGFSAYAPEGRTARGRPWVGTQKYLSPQALAYRQLIHPAADWWALGMIAAETAGGRHPIRYSSAEYIQEEIASRPPDLSHVAEWRLRTLCQGLLTRDPDHRWGSAEVARWLAGEAPPVAPEGPVTTAPPAESTDPADLLDIRPYAFLGQEHTRPRLLALSFSENWGAAARALRRRRAREEFTGWLRQFEGVPGRDDGELRALLALLEREPGPATLVRLITWLGPRLDASYRGVPLDRHGLRELLRAARLGDESALSVVTDLREHTLLPLLDDRPGGDGLKQLGQDWLAALSNWEREATALFDEYPSLGRADTGARRICAMTDTRRVALLELVESPQVHWDRLVERAERTLSGLYRPVPWYARLVRGRDVTGRIPVPDLVRLHLADTLAGLAELESAAARDRAEQDRLIGLATRQARHEEAMAARWLRREDMLPTLGWAVAGAAMLTLPWLFLVGLSDLLGRPDEQAVLTAWLLAVPAAAATLAVEVWTAYRIGPPGYHPDRSVAGLVIDRSLPFARFVRQPGARFPLRGLLVLVPVLLLWLTIAYAPWLWPLLTVAAVLAWSVRRLYAWHQYTADLRAGIRATGDGDGTDSVGNGRHARNGGRA